MTGRGFDQAKFDGWVAKGFNPVAAAFAAGADSTLVPSDDPEKPGGTFLVEVPK